MDFAKPHVREEGITADSKIRVLPVDDTDTSLDAAVIRAANHAAIDLFGCSDQATELADAQLYPERLLDSSKNSIIEPNQLVVIFESFDNLKFAYATPKAYFSNRNGHFCHDDFIGKRFGCQLRSRNNQGYGYVYILKPTPELWARSLPHRTQIVHELDASMIIFYLELRPNMVVCESGTGSGAMSHAILRSIAPQGLLHTYEFNRSRVEKAREEFVKHKVDHLVTVHHQDVCGKHANSDGGFGLGGQAAHAVFLDLPEPWLAVPHAAYVLKRSGKLASYSPCVEQSQRVIETMRQCGFHSIKTVEVRLREHFVADVVLEMPPTEKRPRENLSSVHGSADAAHDHEKDEAAATSTETRADGANDLLAEARAQQERSDESIAKPPAVDTDCTRSSRKRKSMLCTRPFATMRGHTAFLTFATAGNATHPDPNDLTRASDRT